MESFSPASSSGDFDARIIFSEQIYSSGGSSIATSDFSLTGFADNSIFATITLSAEERTTVVFSGLSLPSIQAVGTISISAFADGVGNLSDATSFSIIHPLVSGDCSGIDFDGGSGVTDDPYQISNLCQLQNMGVISDNHLVLNNLLSSHYELTAEIDASWTTGWNLGRGFSPIGTQSNPFTGTFERQ